MKNSDIKNLSLDELIRRIKIFRNDYKKIKFNHSVKKQENWMFIKHLRKFIAKLQTELNKKIK
ncbi:50S ribosomal protein L29 [Blattabacterium cuenoti]|uniref:50S ribosomal protein L29 n=1 Tax=Blattabacterium cuenoti TaxID=1653831 RepID=UPI00163C49E5|nr:50S ribosomal protein L29 [Blattabacterium cuenoti]